MVFLCLGVREWRMDWDTLRDLMLKEPKPALRCVVEQQGSDGREVAKLLHDGAERWLIENGKRSEINDGQTGILVEGGVIEAFQSGELYSNGWIKSLLHPRLTLIGGSLRTHVSGEVVGDQEFEGQDCWLVSVHGLRQHDRSVFDLLVDKESGIVLSITRKDMPEVFVRVRGLELHTEAPEDVFLWRGEIDLDHR